MPPPGYSVSLTLFDSLRQIRGFADNCGILCSLSTPANFAHLLHRSTPPSLLGPKKPVVVCGPG